MIEGYLEKKITTLDLNNVISIAELCVTLSTNAKIYIDSGDYSIARQLLNENLKYLNILKEKDLEIYGVFKKFFDKEITNYNKSINNYGN